MKKVILVLSILFHANLTCASTVIIGDSVLAGLKYSSAAKKILGNTVKLEVKECRKLTTSGCFHGSPESALSVLQSNRDTDNIVIMIGHNDERKINFRKKVNQIINATTDSTHIFWVTMREISQSYTSANQVIREELSSRKNSHIVDWNNFSYNQSSWVVKDGTHLTSEGVKKMAILIASTLDNHSK